MPNNNYLCNSTVLNRSVSRLQRSDARSLYQQLSLLPLKDDLPPYPLQIISIPYNKRIKPDFICGLVHYESGFKTSRQFTYEEAQKILEATRYWDFTLDKNKKLRCQNRLLFLLEKVYSDRQSSKDWGVAA